jgi:FUS-interacting serine-arginine-rich protein 1
VIPSHFQAISKMTILTVAQLMTSVPTMPADKHLPNAYSKSLLLRKVPRRSTDADIRTVFETFGAVRDIYIPINYMTGKKESYAFVEFMELRSAIKAHNYLKENELLLEGIILRTDFARNGRRSSDEMVVRPTVPVAVGRTISSSA